MIMQNQFWISLGDLIIRKGYFTIDIIEIGFKEGGYRFRIFGIHINRFNIDLQILGIPITIPRRPKVR